jgi:hypothetical protein
MTLPLPPDNSFLIAGEIYLATATCIPMLILLALEFYHICKLQRGFVKSANCSESSSCLQCMLIISSLIGAATGHSTCLRRRRLI